MRNRIACCRAAALAVGLVSVAAEPLPAQSRSAIRAIGPAAMVLRAAANDPNDGADPARIGLLEVGATFGALAVGTLADRPLRDWLQRRRTPATDAVAHIFRRMGQPEVYAPVGLGTLAVGLLAGSDKITRAGGRISASLMLSGATVNVIKLFAGRKRPRFAEDPYEFGPFSGAASWPSGHTAMAFTLATSVADEVRSTPVSIGVYAAATMTGWSRMNDNRHWFTDVVTGALIGMTSAKVMNGRWRVLGINGPRFLLEPRVEDTPLDAAARTGGGLRLMPGDAGPRVLIQPGAAGVAFSF